MKFLYLFIVAISATLLSFAQINNGNSTSINTISNTNENIYWEQVYHIDSANILPFNQADFDAYKKITYDIKTVKLNVDNQFIKDSTANPKDIFETTQEYYQRISNIKSNYEKNKNNQINPLEQQLIELENNYYSYPTNVKVDFDLNKYNADFGKWDIDITENGKLYVLALYINRTEAKKLWLNLSSLKAYELKTINPLTFSTLQLKYNDQIGALTLQKFTSEENSSEEQKIFTRVDVESGYAGGVGAWRRYLQNNLDTEVPGSNGAPKGQYTVIVRFIVAKDGTISNVVAETKHGFGMEKESVRAILKSGKWTPAIKVGRNVKSYKRQPITWVVSE
jgi:hypothetical protein